MGTNGRGDDCGTGTASRCGVTGVLPPNRDEDVLIPAFVGHLVLEASIADVGFEFVCGSILLHDLRRIDLQIGVVHLLENGIHPAQNADFGSPTYIFTDFRCENIPLSTRLSVSTVDTWSLSSSSVSVYCLSPEFPKDSPIWPVISSSAS